MTETQIFDQQNTSNTKTDNSQEDVFLQEPPDPNKDYVSELVGEGKKFKSVQDLAYGKVVADRFVDQLKSELSELRKVLKEKDSELKTRIKYEDFLQKLENLNKSSPGGGEPRQKSTDDPKLTEEYVEKIISQREEKRRRAENLAAVASSLRQAFGDSYESRIRGIVQEQGISLDMFRDIAERSPAAALSLIGIRNSQTASGDSSVFTAPPRTSTRPPETVKKNFQYYQKLRKEKGESWYFSVPVQQEIWKEAQAQGEGFFK